MFWRKWAVRFLVYSAFGGLAAAGLTYQYWTNPAAVRRAVLDKLTVQFEGAHVTLESARLRLLGGIALSDLRLSRRDDADRAAFAYVPSAVVYHDKEQLAEGRLAVRKLELHRPCFRVLRGRDGRWNLAGILAPARPAERLPAVVIRQGTLLLEDRLAAPGATVMEVKDVNLTLCNDPVPQVAFEGGGVCEIAGAVKVRGTWDRASGTVTLDVEAPAVPVGPNLVQRLAGYCPDLAAHLRHLEGTGKLRAALAYRRDRDNPLTHDVHFDLGDGRFSHARLPWPLDQVRASLHVVNGQVPAARLSARAGATSLELTARELTPVPSPKALEEIVRELDVKVEHLALPLPPELFDQLPKSLQQLQHDYSPSGPVTATLSFRREAPGRWRQRCVVNPEGIRARFVKFPYPAERITGTIERETTSAPSDVTRLDLAGSTGTRPLYLKGEVGGAPGASAVAVDVWGDDVTLDEKALAALPGKIQDTARKFHPEARGDFRAFIRRGRGAEEFQNRYVVTVRDGKVRYDVFPYPLEGVTGTLDIRPTHYEFRDFRGTHKGGEIRASGRSSPGPGGGRLTVEIQGKDVVLDEEFEAALAAGRPALERAWKTFAATGKLSFSAEVIDVPGQPQDLDVTVSLKGCTAKPTFFPYALDDVGAWVRYCRDGVYVADVRGRHGNSLLSVDRCVVYLKPGGGFWAQVTDLRGSPLVPDEALREALPAPLRKAFRAMNLNDPLSLRALLIIDQASEPGSRPVVYWDGGVALSAASLRAGADLTGVSGQVWCRGRHNGERLEGVSGNVLLERATAFGQPFHNVHSRVVVLKDSPEVLRLPDLKARLFGGNLGGEARVEFGPTLHYAVDLSAVQVRLEDFGRHNFGDKAELSGLANARLYLTGEGDDLNGLKGKGTLDVPRGKMLNLPLLLDLLKFLGLRFPDRTAFEEAHAAFAIDGPRLVIDKLDLFGNAISLRGKGDMRLDGKDLDLDLNADWGRVNQLLPPGLKKVQAEISDQLLRIKMQGEVGKVKFTNEPMPILVDPVKRVLQAGQGKAPAARATSAP